jgi:hypothetical protein
MNYRNRTMKESEFVAAINGGREETAIIVSVEKMERKS